ncbi:MAG: hypothetical protein WCL18_10215 [bacterium]
MVVDAVDKTNVGFLDSKLMYTNRIDGVEHEGLKIEQDLTQ